ncbi:MAG: response regulator [Candidatus Zapsychrus exili]|nr:response regulator [Candidatus Zapsychrus exili]
MGNKKILIVDDDDELLGLLEKKLIQEEYDVVKITSGKDAIEKTKKYGPDIILMDIIMPDIDGAEVARQLQADSLTRNIPLIFLTGMITKDDKASTKSSLKVGDREYPAIGKPFTSQELLDTINRVLG